MITLEQARLALRERQGAGARYDAPNAPADFLAAMRLGVAYFSRLVNDIDDQDLYLASKRQGWSRARVIAGVSLQARAIAQGLEDMVGFVGERAETDDAALALAETLPARALRHLYHHAEIHLNVVLRDLSDVQWDMQFEIGKDRLIARDSVAIHGRTLWRAALDLGARGRLSDVPQLFVADM